jgi:hypothetical protein
MIFEKAKEKYSCARHWTAQISLIGKAKFDFSRTRSGAFQGAAADEFVARHFHLWGFAGSGCYRIPSGSLPGRPTASGLRFHLGQKARGSPSRTHVSSRESNGGARSAAGAFARDPGCVETLCGCMILP